MQSSAISRTLSISDLAKSTLGKRDTLINALTDSRELRLIHRVRGDMDHVLFLRLLPTYALIRPDWASACGYNDEVVCMARFILWSMGLISPDANPLGPDLVERGTPSTPLYPQVSPDPRDEAWALSHGDPSFNASVLSMDVLCSAKQGMAVSSSLSSTPPLEEADDVLDDAERSLFTIPFDQIMERFGVDRKVIERYSTIDGESVLHLALASVMDPHNRAQGLDSEMVRRSIWMIRSFPSLLSRLDHSLVSPIDFLLPETAYAHAPMESASTGAPSEGMRGQQGQRPDGRGQSVPCPVRSIPSDTSVSITVSTLLETIRVALEMDGETRDRVVTERIVLHGVTGLERTGIRLTRLVGRNELEGLATSLGIIWREEIRANIEGYLTRVAPKVTILPRQ
jgi:hypothetical protein